MQRFGRLFVLLAAFVLSTYAMTATGYYVSPTGNDANDGLTLLNAKLTIQNAVNVADGGDVINVVTGTYNESVDVGAGKNNLTIVGLPANNGDPYPTLDGTGLGGGSRAVGFYIAADNVTIQNFTIQDYVAQTNGSDFINDGGAAIVSINQSAGHVFNNLTIENCTWGMYLSNTSDATVTNTSIDLQDNPKVNSHGGVGIIIVSTNASNSIDLNTIGTSGGSNTITNCVTNGIQIGSTTFDVNAEGTYIQYNTITDCGDTPNSAETEGYAIAIWNLEGAVEISENTFETSATSSTANFGMYLSCLNIDESNNDVYVNNNMFDIPNDIIVKADQDFAGIMLYDIWWNNSNDFGGSVLHSAAALTSGDEITDSRTDAGSARFIRYDIQDAIDDADNNERVMVSDGTYEECLDIPVSIELFAHDDPTGANTNSPDSHVIICDDIVTASATTFSEHNPQHEVYAINGDVYIHGFSFKTDITPASEAAYILGITESADAEIENNKFYVPLTEASGTTSIGIVNDYLGSEDGIGGLDIHDNWFLTEESQLETTDDGYFGIRMFDNGSTSFTGDPVQIFDNMFGMPLISNSMLNGVIVERSEVEVTGNTFYTDYSGVVVGSYEPSAIHIGVEYSGSSYDYVNDVLVQCNNINDDSFAAAIAAGTSTFTNVEIYSNNISDAAIGVYVGSANGIEVYYHDFSNYSSAGPDYAVYNADGSNALDIRYNFWGTGKYGPTHPENVFNTSSQGSLIYDDSDVSDYQYTFAPWWTDYTGACPSVATGTEFEGPVYLYNAAETNLKGLYSSIQLAVDAAATGDHIIVKEGTYSESVTVDEEVYLRGKKPVTGTTGIPSGTADAWTGGTAGTGSGPIVAGDGTGTLFFFAADNVSMRGFNLDMTATGVTAGVQFTGSLNNSRIEYCSFDLDGTDAGVDVSDGNGVNYLDVNWNTFTTASSTTWFQITPTSTTTSNVTLSNNDVDGNNNAYFGLGAGIAGVTVNNNDIADGGFVFADPSATFTGRTFSGIYFHHNTFQNGSTNDPALYIMQDVLGGTDIADFDNEFKFLYNIVLDTDASPAVGFESASISLNGGNDLEARWNFWASANGPAVKHDGNYGYVELEGNQFEYPTQGAEVTPGVEFVRWFTTNALTTLYAPIWNNDSPVDYFANLDDALAGTDAANIVYFDDGDFAFVTSSTITQSVKLQGKGYSATTVLDGQYKNSGQTPGAPWVQGDYNEPMIFVAADNVTIDGFKIDLGNDANDFDGAVWTDAGALRTTVYIQDSWLLYAAGFDGTDREKLVSFPWAADARVLNSLLETAGTDIGGAFSVASGSVTNLYITDNTFKPYTTAEGGVNQSGYGSVLGCVQDGLGTFLGGITNAEISGNSASYSGSIDLGFGDINSDNIVITCNTFEYTNGAIDVFTTDASATLTDLTITQNIFSNYTAVPILFRADDNTIQDDVNINFNSFTDETSAAIYVAANAYGGTAGIDATDNYYDSQYGPENALNTYVGSSTADQGAAITDVSGSLTFVPFWTEVSGLVCNLTGTSYAPIIRATDEDPATATILEYYSSIQAAIDDASAGQFIWVKNGTYQEDNIDAHVADVCVVGKKADGLTSAYDATTPGYIGGPTIIPTSSPSELFTITADNVSLRGLRMIPSMAGPTVPAVEIRNISISNFAADHNTILQNPAVGVAVTSASITGTLLDYNVFTGTMGYALLVEESEANNTEFSNNDVENSLLLFGINDDDLSVVDINNNDFNASELIYYGSSTGTGTLASASITNNNFENTSEVNIGYLGLLSDANVATDWSTDMILYHNSFTSDCSVSYSITGTSSSLTAECNWWGSANGPDHADNTKMGTLGATVSDGVDYLPWLNDGTDVYPSQVGFQTVASCVGANVYVATTADMLTTADIVDYYASIQTAIDDANDGEFIWVTNGSYLENVTPATGEGHGWVNDGDTYINGNIDLSISNTSSASVTLYDEFYATGNMPIGGTAHMFLGDNDMNVGGTITNVGVCNSFVVTNGTGSLVAENVDQYDLVLLPIGVGGEYLPIEFRANSTNFLTGSKYAARVNATNPADEFSKGDDTYATDHTYYLGAYDPTGTIYPESTDLDLELRFGLTCNSTAGTNFDAAWSYAARWDEELDPDAWTDYGSGSNHTTDLLQVSGVDHLQTAWGIFSGTSAFALNDEPTPAQIIIFRKPANPDSELKFRWTNGDGTGVLVGAIQASSMPTDGSEYPVDGQEYPTLTDNGTVGWAETSNVTRTSGKLIYKNDNVTTRTEELVLTGLNAGTEYTIGVFSFNGSSNQTNYFTNIDGTPDLARRNSRSYWTWPLGSMTVASGTPACATPTTSADVCAVVCYDGDLDLVFDIDGGQNGANSEVRYSNGQTTDRVTGILSFPYTYTVNNIITTNLYTLISMRDNRGKACVIDPQNDEVEVQVNVPPTVTILTADQDVCENDNFTVTADVTGNPTPTNPVWSWTTDGGTSWAVVSTDAGNAFGTSTGSATVTGNNLVIDSPVHALDGMELMVTYSNVSGCGAATVSSSNSITINIDQAPNANGTWATTRTAFCESEVIELEFTADGAAYGTRQWQWNDGSTWINVGGDFTVSGTSASITSNQISYSSASFRIVYSNGVCTDANTTVYGPISVSDAPNLSNITEEPAGAVCIGDDKVLWITYDNISGMNNPKLWETDGSSVTEVTSGSFSLAGNSASWTVTAQDGFQYWATASNGACSETTTTVTLTASPIPTITTIEGFGDNNDDYDNEIDVCDDGTATFSTNVADATSITWYVDFLNDAQSYIAIPLSGSFEGTTVTARAANSSTLTLSNVPYSRTNPGDPDWKNAIIKIVASNGTCASEVISQMIMYDAPIFWHVTGDIQDNTTKTICIGGDLEYSALAYSQACGPVVPTWWTNANASRSWTQVTTGSYGSGDYAATISIPALAPNTIEITGVSGGWDGAEVEARFVCGPCGAVSSPASTITVDLPPAAPAAVAVAAHDTYPATRITADWADVTDADDYTVQVFTSADVQVGSDVVVTPSSWTASDCALDPNMTYYVKVRANSTCGSSSFTSSPTITTTEPTVTFVSQSGTDFGYIEEMTESSTSYSVLYTFSELDYPIQVSVADNDGNDNFRVREDAADAWASTITLTDESGTFWVQYYPQGEHLNHSGTITVQENATCYAGDSFTVEFTGAAYISEPAQDCEINFTSNASTSFTFTFQEYGTVNGGHIVVLMEGYSLPAFTWTPSDFTDYADNNGSWSSATEVASGFRVVDVIPDTDGSNTTHTVTVTGLESDKNYVAHVFAYNQGSGPKNYNTSDCSQNPWTIYQLRFLAAYMPAEVELSHDTFDELGVERTDRLGNPITDGTVNITLTPVDAGTLADAIYDDGTYAGAVANNTGNIGGGSSSVTFASFEWDSYPNYERYYQYMGDGRAYNKIKASATGYLSGYTENSGTDDGFVLRATEPYRQARRIQVIDDACVGGEGMVQLSWSNGRNGNARVVVMRENNYPSLPVDGEYYNVGSGNINFTTNTVVVPEGGTDGSKAIANGDVDESGEISGLNDDTYYYAKVTEYRYNGHHGVAAPTTNYIDDLGTGNPLSIEIPDCRITAGGMYVELDQFTAKSYNANAYLDFNTTFEQGIVGFELYRADVTNTSWDAVDFDYVKVGSFTSDAGLVAIGGVDNRYSFVDDDVNLRVGDEYLYKLVAVGIDGREFLLAHRDVIILSRENEEAGLFVSNLMPVPATDHLTFTLELQSSQNVTVNVLDLSGRKVLGALNGSYYSAGAHDIKINLDNVVSGTYILNIRAGEDQIIKKFIIAR